MGGKRVSAGPMPEASRAFRPAMGYVGHGYSGNPGPAAGGLPGGRDPSASGRGRRAGGHRWPRVAEVPPRGRRGRLAGPGQDGTYRTASPSHERMQSSKPVCRPTFVSRVERLLPASRLDGWRRSLGLSARPRPSASTPSRLRRRKPWPSCGGRGSPPGPWSGPPGAGLRRRSSAAPSSTAPSLARGRVYVQNPSSMVPVLLLDPQPGGGGPGPGGGARAARRRRSPESWGTADASPRWSR